MSKSDRVRAADGLAILRLVGECVALGDDAAAWQGRLVDGLLALTGGMVAAVGPTPRHPAGGMAAIQEWVAQQTGGGWPSAAVRAKWERLVADPAAIRAHPAVARFWGRPEPALTLTRRELVADGEWDRSPFVNDLLRADGMDEGLVSRIDVPAVGGGYCLTVVRERGAAAFGPRAGRVAAAVQRELAPHLGRGLLLTTQPNRHGLTPRLREVLDRLLDGDSEKLAAARLGLRASTVHDHVKRLYAHFGVGSRAELLAYFLRRHRR